MKKYENVYVCKEESISEVIGLFSSNWLKRLEVVTKKINSMIFLNKFAPGIIFGLVLVFAFFKTNPYLSLSIFVVLLVLFFTLVILNE